MSARDWGFLAVALLILGVAALAFTPHRHRCCGRSFTTPEMDEHIRRYHNE